MYSFTLPQAAIDSEILVINDLRKLIGLSVEPHLASDLEIRVRNKNDSQIIVLYTYMALWKVRMPKVSKEAF